MENKSGSTDINKSKTSMDNQLKQEYIIFVKHIVLCT